MTTAGERDTRPRGEKSLNSKGAWVLVAVITGSWIYGCGSAASTASPAGSNSTPTAPTVNAIVPNSAFAGGAAFTLTISGTNFVTGSMVNFGGAAPAATFVNSTELTAAIPAASIASSGTLTVSVTNPGAGGGTSNVMNFTINNGTSSVPTISSISPSCAPAGEQILNPNIEGQLLINGQNFAPSSVVRWNGNDRPTTFFGSSGQLAAQISVSDIAAAGTATVTVFNPGGGTSNSSSFTITTGGIGPASIAVDPAGKFAYVANQGCGDSTFGNVSMYTINPNTGSLTSVGPPVNSGDEGADSVAVDPSGKFAYVGNSGGGDTPGSVSAYAIDTGTGSLSFTGRVSAPCGPPPSPGSCSPWSLVVDPSGKFAYVANEGGFAPTSVSMYTINATTGSLTPIGTIAAEGRAVSVAADPTGKFIFVLTLSSLGSTGNISAYKIDTTSGVLTLIGTLTAGTNSNSVAVDPMGKFVYVTNSGSNDISMYTISTVSGALMSLGTIPGAGGSIAVHPSGKFAYVSNSSGTLSLFDINATTGILTSTGTTGAAGSSIAIHPSGKFAYVTNSVSNKVSIYNVDASTGVLTLIETIGT